MVAHPCIRHQKMATCKLWNYYCQKVQKWILGVMWVQIRNDNVMYCVIVNLSWHELVTWVSMTWVHFIMLCLLAISLYPLIYIWQRMTVNSHAARKVLLVCITQGLTHMLRTIVQHRKYGSHAAYEICYGLHAACKG